MKYNFNEIVDRKGTDSKKWSDNKSIFGREDLLPAWVADMDFKSPQPLIDGLKERAEHGVFGYPYRDRESYQAIMDWTRKRYDWEIEEDWIVFIPGVIMGLNIGILELSEPGDKVAVQTPVYPPFINLVEKNERLLLDNSLVNIEGEFKMDLEDLEGKIDKSTSLMMLCHPHNPVGREWREEELEDLARICMENNMTIISDEIHGDFSLDRPHRPLASISEEIAQRTVTLMSPSKTFNIAGLGLAVAIIPNGKIRKKFQDRIELMGLSRVDIFGNLAFKLAYNEGEAWLDQLLVYLKSNIDYALDYIERELPDIRVNRPDASYLLWLDFRGLNKPADQIMDALVNVGKIALNDGRPYGANGENFFRLNIGTPRPILEDVLGRISLAVDSLK